MMDRKGGALKCTLLSGAGQKDAGRGGWIAGLADDGAARTDRHPVGGAVETDDGAGGVGVNVDRRGAERCRREKGDRIIGVDHAPLFLFASRKEEDEQNYKNM